MTIRLARVANEAPVGQILTGGWRGFGALSLQIAQSANEQYRTSSRRLSCPQRVAEAWASERVDDKANQPISACIMFHSPFIAQMHGGMRLKRWPAELELRKAPSQ